MSFKEMSRRASIGLLASKTDFDVPRLLSSNVLSQLRGSVEDLARHMKIEVTREDYLLWVQTWKKLYAQVSVCIRNLKDYRDGRGPVGDNVWESIRSHRQSDVEHIRKYATHLIELRHINKVLAGRARERHLAAQDVANART